MVTEQDRNEIAPPSAQDALGPELRNALMSGQFCRSREFRKLAHLAGLTNEMVEAGVANYVHQERFEPEDFALARAFVAMVLVSGNAPSELVQSAKTLLSKTLQQK